MDAQAKLYLSNFWWVLTLRGVAAILFGVAAVFWPTLTLVTVVYLFSAYILFHGVLDTVHGLSSVGKRGIGWIVSLLLGILEVGLGVYLLRHTLVSFDTFILLVGFMLIVRGVLEFVAAFMEEQVVVTRTLLLISGAVSVLAGMVLLRQPAEGGVAFVWILGVYALVTGPVLLALSIDAKHLLDEWEAAPPPKNKHLGRT